MAGSVDSTEILKTPPTDIRHLIATKKDELDELVSHEYLRVGNHVGLEYPAS